MTGGRRRELNHPRRRGEAQLILCPSKNDDTLIARYASKGRGFLVAFGKVARLDQRASGARVLRSPDNLNAGHSRVAFGYGGLSGSPNSVLD